MQSRIVGRINSYQIKLLIRCDKKIINVELIIIRHAPNVKFTPTPYHIHQDQFLD